MSRVILTADEDREVHGLIEAAMIHAIEQAAQRVVALRRARGRDVCVHQTKRTLCDYARAALGRMETAGGAHLASRRVVYAEQIESLQMELGQVPQSW